MKVAIALIVGLALGAVGGAGLMHQRLMPQLLEANAALRATQSELATLKTRNSEAMDRLARLETERADHEARLDAAHARLERARAVEAATPAPPVRDVEEEMVDPLAAAATGAEDGNGDGEGDDDDARGRRGRWGGTPEEREARRQEFMERIQENMTDFFTGELEKSRTPAMQDRLVALENQAYAMFELRSEMREAETEADRDALRQAYRETEQVARDLMADQQREMIGAIAAQFGISNRRDQAAFEQAVQTAVSSPLFSDNPNALFWGAMRSGGPGRFGGGPGRR